MTGFGLRQSGRRAAHVLALGVAILAPTCAMAQDAELAPELQCLRYVQAQERAKTIPVGLLTAITMVESGRRGDDGKVNPWPWTINVGGRGMYFASKEEAIAETRKLMDEGQRSIDVGCMQINLRYHPNAFKNLEEAFDPAANVAYGAQFLKSLHLLQGSWPNAVERFHSSEDGRRAEYRERVLTVWNDDARTLIMNAVMAENTDTPYHRALRDFVDAKYSAALDKYQDIVDKAPKDRLGLLGLAMTFERLGRTAEAHDSYARYLVVEIDPQKSAPDLALTLLEEVLLPPPPPEAPIACDADDASVEDETSDDIVREMFSTPRWYCSM